MIWFPNKHWLLEKMADNAAFLLGMSPDIATKIARLQNLILIV